MHDHLQTSEQIRFPAERIAVASIQERYRFQGVDAIDWGIEHQLFAHGDIKIAEVSPSLRCSESCYLCPDSSILLQNRIDQGLEPKMEARAGPDEIKKRIKLLTELGVEHFMFIGGTIDYLPELPELFDFTLDLGRRVSWFTDMIQQLDVNTGRPSIAMTVNLNQGWLRDVATHVSVDYAYPRELLSDRPELPEKKGRIKRFREDDTYSRRFKSEYGMVGLRRLIEAGVRRVVANIMVAPNNLEEVPSIYQQVDQLQQYATENESPTEVYLTGSPAIWRPHQARGDNPNESPSSAGLQMSHMGRVNSIFGSLLDLEYKRINAGQPRLFVNSSGYLQLLSDSRYQQIVVDQGLRYMHPEVFQVRPDGSVWLDPMFPGPELSAVCSIFGYRDRIFEKDRNPFSRFQDEREWFPNIVST